ncbi:MAG: efflux RND transporter periplasmic adaptor subunit, partial [Bradymonadaceae bacterium]
MNQKIYLIIGILVAISVTSACLGAAPAESSEAEAEAPILEALLPSQGSAPEVSVVTVETGTVEQTRNWVATMQPLDQYPVQAPMAGVITRQAVRVGDEVQQGDFLVRLDIPGTRGRQAALTQRRDTLQTDVQRWERLIDRGAAGPAELEAARLRLLDAEEALAELDATLGARRLTAPVAGIVSQSSFTEGAHVVAGQPLLTITDRASMGLRLTVPTADAAHFREP